jgi:hypothetical protein
VIGMNRDETKSEEQRSAIRKKVHLAFAGLFLLLVMYFKLQNNKEIVTILLDIAGYTYGPLLGLFAFGIFTKHAINDRLSTAVCLIVPTIAFIIDKTSIYWMGGYKFGFEMLAINGLLTYVGLWGIKGERDKG